MKVGEFERLSNLCGIAKVEYKNEELFVIYSSYLERDQDDFELGVLVGKGKNEIDALKNAIVNMAKNIKKTSEEIEEFNDTISSLKLGDNVLNFDDEPIVSVEMWRYKGDEIVEDTGEFVNADLRLFEGKAELGIM